MQIHTNMITTYLETKKEGSDMNSLNGNTDTTTTTDTDTKTAVDKGAVKRIRWGAPPELPVVVKEKRGYDALMDRVRKNAGQWGLVSRNVNIQTVYYLRKRYPDLKFEWRGTKASCKIWAIKPVEAAGAAAEESSNGQAPSAGQTDLTS